MSVAFFDLDRTLIARNSGALWLRWEVSHGQVSLWQAVRAWSWIARYHLGAARLEDAILDAISAYAGQLDSEVAERTRAFYESRVRGLVRPGAWTALSRHRAAGDAIALLTSSSSYLSKLVGSETGIEHLLCNNFEVDGQGRLTGRPVGGLCFGPGKVGVARQFCVEGGSSFDDAWFYSDSASDLPMLEAVRHPVAVNPDPRLKREARRRGWAVEDWGEPSPAPGPTASIESRGGAK